MGLSMMALLLALLKPASSTDSRLHEKINRLASLSDCRSLGNFHGCEDATLYHDGLAFMSSGLVPSSQPGLILAVSFADSKAAPHVTPVPLLGVPAGFGFRPHGLHLDNISKRVYAISHSDERQVSSIDSSLD